MLSRERIYGLKRGEVIAYRDGRGRIQLIYVDHVDVERGKVSGEISSCIRSQCNFYQ